MVTAPTLPARLAPLYPFTPRRRVTPGGATMSYLDEGPRTDEAVLFLHGNPTWSFFYRDLVRELSPAIRCIAPDHVGMGLSEKPEGYDYRLASRIDDIEALVDELGLKRVHLVVHDWGGAIGIGWAARRPDLVGRIVILNTAAFPSDQLAARDRALPGAVPGRLPGPRPQCLCRGCGPHGHARPPPHRRGAPGLPPAL